MTRSLGQTIGANIRRARERAGMTQEQLGTAVGLEAATLSRHETGTRPPRLETLERIAAALKIDVFELVAVAPVAKPLRSDEKELMSTYRSMRPTYRHIALRLVRELRKIQ